MDEANRVDGLDEQRHQPGAEALWNESVYLDLVDASGSIGGYVRLGLYPNEGVIWWTAAVTWPDRGPVIAARYDLPVPATSFNIDHAGEQVRYDVETSLEVVRVTASTAAKSYDDAASTYDLTAGTPVPLELDLTWSTNGVPYHYGVTTRYEIPCTVAGTITVNGEVFNVAGPGQRDHSWGVRDWWAFGWCWAALHFDDGQLVHLADIRLDGVPPLGYVQRDGDVASLTELVTSETVDGEGLASSSQVHVGPGPIDIKVTPTGFGPLLLVAEDGRMSRFPRAMVEAERSDGVRGRGWMEWNQPQLG